MRNCVASLLLLLLLAVNGYALWQITRLRAEVAELRATVAALETRPPQSDADLAEAALEAAQHGQWERARAALQVLAERIEETEALAERPRREVQQRLAEARRALDRKRQEAAAAIQALRDELSPHKREGRRGRDNARSPGNSLFGQGV
jgi:chromosome segregation ATPase